MSIDTLSPELNKAAPAPFTLISHLKSLQVVTLRIYDAYKARKDSYLVIFFVF